MNATQFEFRYRVPIIVLIYAFGFFAPWEWIIDQPARGESWGLLIAQLSRTGLLSFNASFVLVNSGVLLCAIAGAGLRLWATAYLGARTMWSGRMLAETMVTAGPYRYVSNPLYAGAWLLAVPLAILMRPGGAAFLMIGLGIFLVRLANAEQVFLSQSFGKSYRGYLRNRRNLRSAAFQHEGEMALSALMPEWSLAVIAESYGLLLAISFSIFCWRFNAGLLLQCAIVSFGASLALNAAFAPRRKQRVL